MDSTGRNDGHAGSSDGPGEGRSGRGALPEGFLGGAAGATASFDDMPVYRDLGGARALPQGAQARTLELDQQPVFRSLVLPADAAQAPSMGAMEPKANDAFGPFGSPGGAVAMDGLCFESLGPDKLAAAGLAPPSFGGSVAKPPTLAREFNAFDSSAYDDAPATTQPSAATMDYASVQVLPLPSCSVLEPNCHFFVRGTTSELARHVSEELLAANVDFELKAAKGKWKAKWYSPCNRLVDLRVRLFQQSGRLVCELQRRAGCCMSFRSLYAEVRAGLVDRGVVVGTDGAAVTQCAPAPMSNTEAKRIVSERVAGPPVLQRHADPAGECSEALESLVLMAGGEFAEPRAESFRVLASMAACAKSAASLRAANALPAAVAALACPCPDARRCAAVTVANLAEHVEVKGALVDAGAIAALLQLITDDAQELCARREGARALANLSDAYATEILDAGGPALSAMLDACDAIPDARFRGYAMRARTQLVAVS